MTARVTRVQFDSDYDELTITAQRYPDPKETPKTDDVPEDLVEAVRRWLAS